MTAYTTHLRVEAAGAEEGLVQVLGAVGCPQDDHALTRHEAVHLREKLVDGLVGIGMQLGVGPLRADAVDLVDEDHAGGALLRHAEQVAHASGSLAHQHLYMDGRRK